jgi:LysM repeat protein
MNPDLLSANVSLAFMALAGAAALSLLYLASRGRPLLYLLDAVAAAGLFYFFGMRAFGWGFIPREAFFVLYAGVFSVAAAIALTRLSRESVIGFPAREILLTQGAMAYIFSPLAWWRPLVSLLLMGYFLLDAIGWLKGSEAPMTTTRDHRPPLFPPRRRRGLREFALAGLAAALAYVFVVGTGREPPAAPPEAQTAAAPEAPSAPSAEAETAVAETQNLARAETPEPAAAAPAQAESKPTAPQTYTAVAGDTFKSIAKKLYGKPEKWRALAAANPGLKPGAKLKAGQAVKLPEAAN